jgi:hypothetical protein
MRARRASSPFADLAGSRGTVLQLALAIIAIAAAWATQVPVGAVHLSVRELVGHCAAFGGAGQPEKRPSCGCSSKHGSSMQQGFDIDYADYFAKSWCSAICCANRPQRVWLTTLPRDPEPKQYVVWRGCNVLGAVPIVETLAFHARQNVSGTINSVQDCAW